MILKYTDQTRTGQFRKIFDIFSRLGKSESLGGIGSDLYPHSLRAESALRQGNDDEFENAVTAMYCVLHAPRTAYSRAERSQMSKRHAYGCHAGGLEPVLRSAPYMHEGVRLADFGAGNGLQGLLFQCLYPHRETIQIELSEALIEQGRRLQRLMGIPQDRIRWVHGDMMDVDPEGLDVIYMYRPFRPVGRGKMFYEKFAARLSRLAHPIHVISVADCLGSYLGSSFQTEYDDGHLRIFSARGGALPSGKGRVV